MKFLKENWKMLIIVLIIVVIFPIIILTPSKYGTISYKTGLTIVGYGGSILGGFLTLYGVWWTIKDQEKKRQEDIEIQYRPIIIEENHNWNNNINTFVFKNNGRGELLNATISSSNDNLLLIHFKSTEKIITILPNAELTCDAKCNATATLNILHTTHKEPNVSIFIEGYDIFNRKKLKYEFVYRISFTRNGTPIMNPKQTIFHFLEN